MITPKHNNNEILLKKRETFRQQIRRQYLMKYFEKKRSEVFGWKAQCIYNQKQRLGVNSQCIVEIDISDCCDKRGKQSSKRQLQLEHGYVEDYFKDVILLEKLISEGQSLQQDYFDNYGNRNDNDNERQGVEFKYKSFYEFIITTIQQHLHPQYFNNKFTDNNNNHHKVFSNHFNTLKSILYKKLVQQLQDLLISIRQFNVSQQQKLNTWAYHKILLQTYWKVVRQITNFIKTENIIYSSKSREYQNKGRFNADNSNNDDDKLYPMILIQQQLSYLINMLISITYYDEVKLQNNNSHSQAYKRVNEYVKYQQSQSQLTNQQQDKSINNYNEQQSYRIQMTQIMISHTQLLDTLKFMIVFGPINQSSTEYNQHYGNQNSRQKQQNSDTYSKRRQRIVLLVLELLRNVCINVGSDVLFQKGLVAEIKCILRESYYKVEIRRQRIQNSNINNKNNNNNNNKLSNNNNDQLSNKPLLHWRIQQFIIYILQLIHNEQSQQYLYDMDSFQFVYDTLQQINKSSLRIDDSCPQFYEQIQGQNNKYKDRIVIGGEIELIDYKDDNNDDCQQQQQINQVIRSKQRYRLLQLAQHCIQCLQFHFYLGQIKLKQQHQHNQSSNMTIGQEKKFSTKNRYVVKFNYIPDAQTLLSAYQKGRQLLIQIPNMNY